MIKRIKTNRKGKTNRKKKTRKTRKTRLAKGLSIFLKNNNPDDINELSQQIKTDLTNLDPSISSYSPSINKALVSLKSISRQPISNCNADKAFSMKKEEPLEISIDNKCYSYSTEVAKEFLLKNLSANKHVDPKKIIPPIQSLGNCWFNTMFVTLFVSDKGRKFFHFFRQLMIKGKKADGSPISKDLRNGFALLNYAVDACLQGNQFAYKMDTNTIIKDIYKNIPVQSKTELPYITNIKDAGNPMRYYGSLMFYLQDKSIQMLFVEACNKTWKEQLLKKGDHVPSLDVIVLEFFDDASKVVTNKPTQFSLANGTRYALDSCVVRNTMGHHFCSLLTCEQKEYTYDGMSFHRLVPLAWKKQINKEFTWQFEGSTDADDKLLEWNFRSGYQMLVYYRV
jgi:hypothetical protein